MGIAAHGGELVQRPERSLSELPAGALRQQLDEQAFADVLLLGCGAYSPLASFCDAKACQSIVAGMRLPSGVLWSIPIVCPISPSNAQQLAQQSKACVCLVGPGGEPVAWLEQAQAFEWQPQTAGQALFGTTELKHPGLQLAVNRGEHYVTGELFMVAGVKPPSSLPLPAYTPQQVREIIAERGWQRIVAFQTRNPIHRAHEYLLRCALETCDGLLLHPLMGPTKEDDIPPGLRARCYQALLAEAFAPERVLLSAWVAPMRYAGPKEAILHAIVRQNYGCTHMIVGRDHAGVGNYYGTTAAQQLVVAHHGPDLLIEPMCFDNAFYCHACGTYGTSKTCPHDSAHHLQLSGTQVRRALQQGEALPSTFTRASIATILSEWARAT